MGRENGGSLAWFLAGLGIGAVVGVLYAPRSGRETRQAILDAAEEGRDYVVNKGESARAQAKQWVARGKDTLQNQKEQFKAAYEAGRQAFRETTEGSKS